MIEEHVWFARLRELTQAFARLQFIFGDEDSGGTTLTSLLLLAEAWKRLVEYEGGSDPVLSDLCGRLGVQRVVGIVPRAKLEEPVGFFVADLAEAVVTHIRAHQTVDVAARVFGAEFEMLEGVRWCLDVSAIPQSPLLSTFTDEVLGAEGFEGSGMFELLDAVLASNN
jgi:hypothetical protein